MNSLREVVKWAMREQFGSPLRTVEVIDGMLEQLWIEPPFQIERVTIVPNRKVVTHRHPMVDSWEFYVSGGGAIAIARHRFSIGPDSPRVPLHIPRGVWHGGTTGPDGGCWLSIQQWFCEPSSIDKDWESLDDIAN